MLFLCLSPLQDANALSTNDRRLGGHEDGPPPIPPAAPGLSVVVVDVVVVVVVVAVVCECVGCVILTVLM